MKCKYCTKDTLSVCRRGIHIRYFNTFLNIINNTFSKQKLVCMLTYHTHFSFTVSKTNYIVEAKWYLKKFVSLGIVLSLFWNKLDLKMGTLTHSFKTSASLRHSTSTGSVPTGPCAVPTPRATGAHQKHIPVTLIRWSLFAGICCPKRLYSLTHRTLLTKSQNEPDLTSQVSNQLARTCSKTTIKCRMTLQKYCLSDKSYFKQPW